MHLKLLHRFKDIAVFVVGSFILLHPVHTKIYRKNYTETLRYFTEL